MAKINPDVSGRFEVSMSGTVSVMLTDNCLKNANVNDLVVISDKVARPHRYHRVPTDFRIPVLEKAGDNEDPEDAARRIVTKAMKDDPEVDDKHIGNWRDVLYDPFYEPKNKSLDGYRMKASRPLPGSTLWLEDITRTTGSGGQADSRPILPWKELSEENWKDDFIAAAKTEPADKARRIAEGFYGDSGPTHGSGVKVMKMPTTRTENHSKAIGKLLEKGEGYARLRLFPQTEVSLK